MSHSLFYAILTEAGSLGCCQRSRLFCARPSCDQVALWAIKAKKKKNGERNQAERLLGRLVATKKQAWSKP